MKAQSKAGKLLVEFFQRNPKPTIQLGNAFINGAKSGRIFSSDQLRHGMIDTQLDHLG